MHRCTTYQWVDKAAHFIIASGYAPASSSRVDMHKKHTMKYGIIVPIIVYLDVHHESMLYVHGIEGWWYVQKGVRKYSS